MQPAFGPSTPLAPAFIPSSVYALPDLDALEEISTGQQAGFIYARDNHPNAVQLEAELAKLENAAGAIVCANGMAAIGVVTMAVLEQGGQVIASKVLDRMKEGKAAVSNAASAPRQAVTTTCKTSARTSSQRQPPTGTSGLRASVMATRAICNASKPLAQLTRKA